MLDVLLASRRRTFGGSSQTEQFVTRAVRVWLGGQFEELARRFPARTHAQALAGALDIFVDSEGRQIERAADLFGVHMLRHEPQAFALARGQARDFAVQLSIPPEDARIGYAFFLCSRR
jgi:hypothetical protein